MRYQVLEGFKAHTNKGEMDLQAGQVISLPKERALGLITASKIIPLQAVLDGKYKTFMQWLKGYDLTADEIKKRNPELLKEIHKGIKLIDICFSREDLQGFTKAIENTKRLYLNAVNDIEDIPF